jgi:hypothetical protein
MYLKILLYIILGLCILNEANAQFSQPKYANEFLSIGVGARGLSMGSAVTSSTDDATANYWNPANILTISSQNSVVIQHAEYFAGIAAYDYVGFANRIDDESAIGISFLRFGVDDIPDTRFLYDANGAINYDNITYFSAADYAFQFTYARQIKFVEGLRFGANAKIIHRNVGKFANAWGFGIDAALAYDYKGFQFSLVSKDVFGTFTTWFHNVSLIEETYLQTGNDIPVNSTEVTLPRVILGTAYKQDLPAKFSLLAEINVETTFDGPRNTYISEEMFSVDPKFGVEIIYDNIAFLRFGGNQLQKIKNFDGSQRWNGQANVGIGFQYKTLQIDYAYTDIGNASESLYSHIFTVIINWDAKE